MNTKRIGFLSVLFGCGVGAVAHAVTYDTTMGFSKDKAIVVSTTTSLGTGDYIKGYVEQHRNEILLFDNATLDFAGGSRVRGLFSFNQTMTLDSDLFFMPRPYDSGFAAALYGRHKINGQGRTIYTGGGVFLTQACIELVSDLVIDLQGGTLIMEQLQYYNSSYTGPSSAFGYSDAVGFWINGNYQLMIRNGKILNMFDLRSIHAPTKPIPMIRTQFTAGSFTGPSLLLENVEIGLSPGFIANATYTYHRDRSCTFSNLRIDVGGRVEFFGEGSVLNYGPQLTRIGHIMGSTNYPITNATLVFRDGIMMNYSVPPVVTVADAPWETYDSTCSLNLSDITITCSTPFILADEGYCRINNKVTFRSNLPLSSSQRYIQLGRKNTAGFDCDLVIAPGATLEIDSMKLVNENTI